MGEVRTASPLPRWNFSPVQGVLRRPTSALPGPFSSHVGTRRLSQEQDVRVVMRSGFSAGRLVSYLRGKGLHAATSD